MLLAEAVTFDPEVVVAVFIVFLLVVVGALAVVVTGLVAGFRAGRDPERTRAVAAWRTCLGIDLAALALLVVSRAPIAMTATAAAITAATWASRRLGHWLWRELSSFSDDNSRNSADDDSSAG